MSHPSQQCIETCFKLIKREMKSNKYVKQVYEQKWTFLSLFLSCIYDLIIFFPAILGGISLQFKKQ